jgi:hypothetical protein
VVQTAKHMIPFVDIMRCPNSVVEAKIIEITVQSIKHVQKGFFHGDCFKPIDRYLPNVETDTQSQLLSLLRMKL